MRWSQTLISTLREEPQDAEIASHRLMLRAGLIRRLAGGLYTFLPLGLRALRNVERIVREEMDSAGAIELLMPALQPRELWDRSGRFDTMSDVIFSVRDRQQRDMVLGPTHEEVITDLVAREIKSYRQLPRTFYQIQTKFRDEIRPRFGLMRAKEFIMKDAYSFDLGWEQADASYEAMYAAYARIFDRCGLRTKVVEADTGAMGGKWSHEFMVLAETGEDGIVECSSCHYAANLERAERSFDTPEEAATPDGLPREVSTPAMSTIEDVSSFLRCAASDLVKTLIYLADGEPVALLVPGDRDLNERKAVRELGASHLELADDETIERVTGAPVGFAGPVGLSIPVHADRSLRSAFDMVVGANKADTHVQGVHLERDADVASYLDLCLVEQGDLCPKCRATLAERRGIEVGHVFKLGTKYSENFGATYLDENGDAVPMVMGCYGIGVTRTLQAVIEQCNDERGIVWPAAVAPYAVVVLLLNPDQNDCSRVAAELADSLAERGIEVLMDDRDERPGVKFNDTDLLGFPVRLVVSERSLSKGQVEIKTRTADRPDFSSPSECPQLVEEILSQYSAGPIPARAD